MAPIPSVCTLPPPALPTAPTTAATHWEQINAGLDRRYTLHIAASPDDADVVLVTVSENARRLNPQFYRSTDAGKTWTLVDGLGEGENPDRTWWSPSTGIRASPTTVYAGTDGGSLFSSADRGATWQKLPVQLPTVSRGSVGCIL